ncbi:MAG: FecR domain-containing protein [Opitutales bacterium]|nr:FecR domain-containing protein [Opitutales bacterium]
MKHSIDSLHATPNRIACWLFLLTIPLFLTQVASAEEPEGPPLSELIPDSEYRALVSFYNAMGGSSWPGDHNWLSDDLPWTGVSIEGAEVEFADGGYTVIEQGNVTRLSVTFRLPDNTGSIPASLGNLKELRYLGLANHQLTGRIPASLGSLSKLEFLGLSYNQLSGEIPASLGSLGRLEHLGLAHNELTGEIPPSLGSLGRLERLNLGFNQLTGEIPDTLGYLTGLDVLGLNHNQLTGRIPADFANLTGLESLRIDHNVLAQAVSSTRWIGIRTQLEAAGVDVTDDQQFGWSGEVSIEGGGATVIRDGTPIALSTDDHVFEGDVIETVPDGVVRIRYADSSSTTVGADSSVDIAEFRHNSEDGSDRSIIGLLRGWLRSRTGDIEDVEVRTRNASIGVRGTEFTVEYRESNGNGSTLVSVDSGSVEVTDLSSGGTVSVGASESWDVETALADLDDPEWKWSTWFGPHYSMGHWIYHIEHGWLSLAADVRPAGFHFFDQALGMWGWTSEEVYPWFYWYGGLNDWVFYDLGGSPGERLFHTDADGWQTESELISAEGIEYHLLTSIWGYEAEQDVSIFTMGFEQPFAFFIDAESEQVNQRPSANVFARIGVAGDQSVLTSEYKAYSERFTRTAAFADAGLTISHPEETDGSATYDAWELALQPLGSVAVESVVADVLTGTALRYSSFGGGKERFEYIQTFAAKKSENASIDDLVGEWGIVRLEIESLPEITDDGIFDPAEILYSTLSVPATITADNGGTFSIDGVEMESEIVQFHFNGLPSERRRFEPATIQADFPLHVSPSGETFLEVQEGREGEPHQHMSGFMSPDGDFMAFAEGWPSIHQARTNSVPDGAGESFAAHQLFLGVRLDPNPDLAGREYHLTGQSFWVSRYDYEMSPAGPDQTGTLSFDASGETASLSFGGRTVHMPARNPTGDGFSVATETPHELPPVDYAVDPDGRLNFDLSALTTDDGTDAFFSGFAQEGGEVLVLSFGYVEDVGADGDEGQISLWVATCVNCD